MKINPEKLKTITETRLLDRKEVAEMAGVSAQTIGNWLKGKGEPRMKNIRKLADALKVKPSQITLQTIN